MYNTVMGTLYIVATPIGNLDDITIRALKTLFSVDYIACEDTRRTGQLLGGIESKIRKQEFWIKGIDASKKPLLISYYDEIESDKAPDIIDLLKQGHNVALVSDGGTPLISDPGFKLVSLAIRENISIESIPGPSSVVAALSLSGLPVHNFLFLGYLPPNQSRRKELLNSILSSFKTLKQTPTLVLFESPHRLTETLADMMEVMNDTQEIVVTREMTKIHEEIWRGTIHEALEHFRNPKGEFVLLIHTE